MVLDSDLEKRTLEAISWARTAGYTNTEEALIEVLRVLKSAPNPVNRLLNLKELTMPPGPMPLN